MEHVAMNFPVWAFACSSGYCCYATQKNEIEEEWTFPLLFDNLMTIEMSC